MSQQSKIAIDLFMEHAPTLYGYAFSRVRNHHLAEDLVQDTMISAWKSWDSFQGGSTILVWLTGILRHKLLDQWRSDARKPQTQSLEADEQRNPASSIFDAMGNWTIDPNYGAQAMLQSPSDAAHNSDLRKFIVLCMAKLPQRLLLLFQAREVDDLSINEAAEAAGVTSGSAAVLLTRARHSLRLCLQESLQR
jgi:RNA polymerase sigma-70 factor, ECF subfamily